MKCFDSLYERYPKMFPTHPISGGILCETGWYPLIDTLCANIQAHVDQDGIAQVTVIQIKEKYGELRFYYRGGDPAIRSLVESARERSIEICEICGLPGELNQNSNRWWDTRCVEHRKD